MRLLLPLLAAREMSLDASTNDMPPAIDRIAGAAPSPEDETARHEIIDRAGRAVHAAVQTLDARERMIVEERFMTEDPPTCRSSARASASARSVSASSRSAPGRSSGASFRSSRSLYLPDATKENRSRSGRRHRTRQQARPDATRRASRT